VTAKGDDVTNRFDADTALKQLDVATFEGHVVRRWWVGRGPNGGYIAAIILRALAMAVTDPERTPRSLTVQYLEPPAEGPLQVAITIERAGRSITMLSARLLQSGRLLAIALAAFAKPRPGMEFTEARMPDVPPPEEVPIFTPPGTPSLSFLSCYEYRRAIGDLPFSHSERARTGGWLRLAEPRAIDYPLVAAFTDAWIPSVFPRLERPTVVPTIDLTIHFRSRLPLPSAKPDDFCLAVFQTRLAAEGFFEEDGEIWSPDGVLIAQSRQLALLS
jgi:acyl-CoA thioesterase